MKIARPTRITWRPWTKSTATRLGVGSQGMLEAALDRAVPANPSQSAELPVNCVVFSKDRAMQLDACVRSIAAHAGYAGQVAVIYKATTPEFEEGYRLLGESAAVQLVAESDALRRDVLAAIDPTVEHTVFHTDDDVFFRSVPSKPSVPDGVAAFSLRLGENTTYCYPLDRDQALPPYAARGPVIVWDWTRASGDFGYPMSLDGHVFRTESLLRMLDRCGFSNPNGLEAELQAKRDELPPLMLAFRHSCLLSLPLNIVTSSHRNRAGSDPASSAAVLNLRFLAGERIDLGAMVFDDVHAAHQEVALAFAGGVPES